MEYITTSDLQARVKPDIWDVATNDQRSQAVDGVNDQVDGYLAQAGYDLPMMQDNHAIRRNALHMADWVRLFKKTFMFTGGEIVGEFLMSSGFLPGAHDKDCPVYKNIQKLNPAWVK